MNINGLYAFEWKSIRQNDDGKRVRQLICRRLCHFNDTSIAANLTHISAILQKEKHKNIKEKDK